MTRPAKARHNKTSQGEAQQDETSQGKVSQNKTRQAGTKTRQVRARYDRKVTTNKILNSKNYQYFLFTASAEGRREDRNTTLTLILFFL
jgi:hypothetical protein